MKPSVRQHGTASLLHGGPVLPTNRPLVSFGPAGYRRLHPPSKCPLSSRVCEAMFETLFRSTVGHRSPRALAAGTVLVVLLAACLWSTVSVSTSSAVTQQKATLRERLIYGLLAKIPSEIEYIDRVVKKVHEGELPERLVNQTFFWARERAAPSQNGSPQRPIIYFQPAMTARAKRIGVDL